MKANSKLLTGKSSLSKTQKTKESTERSILVKSQRVYEGSPCSDPEAESKEDEENPMKVLEDALDAAKFGRFNIRLMVALFTGAVSAVLVTNTSSFVVTSSECDLNITLRNKGWLMSAPYFGQVLSALFVGFLSDTFGRKRLVMIGSTGLIFSRLLEGSSQNFPMLYVCNILQGFIFCLPKIALPCYLSEFTTIKHRDSCIILYTGFSVCTNIIVALMAWSILPHSWHIVIIEGYFELHSWNILLYSCSLWSLATLIQFYYLPETPKFLHAHGKHVEALDAIKTAYAENTGKDPSTFPIKRLPVLEMPVQTSSMSFGQRLISALKRAKALIKPPYLQRIIIFSLWSVLLYNNTSSFKSWYPQLLTIVENFKKENGKTESFCYMIDDYYVNNTAKSTSSSSELVLDIIDNMTSVKNETCVPMKSGRETYLSSMMMGFACLTSVVINAVIVKFIGPLRLMFVDAALSCCLSVCLNWAHTTFQISLVMSSLIACLMGTQALFQNNLLRSFPTQIRSLAQSTTVIFLRFGSISGNIVLPVLIEHECKIPLVVLTVTTGVIAAGVWLFPNVAKENEKSGDM